MDDQCSLSLSQYTAMALGVRFAFAATENADAPVDSAVL